MEITLLKEDGNMTRFFRKIFVVILAAALSAVMPVLAQTEVTVARLKYGGGGDWYGNRTSFINIFNFLKKNHGLETADKETAVEPGGEALFQYPIIYIAGHGNIRFNDQEIRNLRQYLTSGGFLWADDDYGMDASFRREMKKVFPELEWVELPFSHPIYHQLYNFPNGLPKIHKHDGGPPHGYGLIYEGRLVCFYTFNTDISDGCENADIHGDPEKLRMEALKMASNIIFYALTH